MRRQASCLAVSGGEGVRGCDVREPLSLGLSEIRPPGAHQHRNSFATCPLTPCAESTMGSGVSPEFTWLPETLSKFGGQQSASCLE